VPALRAATVIASASVMAMFGIISFLPLFVQVVQGRSATEAGRALTPMMLAMMLGSALGARVLLKVGFRRMCMVGFAFLVVGTALLTRASAGTSQLELIPPMACIGAGLGLAFITTMMAAQNSVDLPRMGVATGLLNFCRQLGGALGVAIGGTVMLTTLSDRIATAFPHRHIKAGSLLSAQTAANFPPAAQDLVRHAFADALHLVFVATFILAVIGAFTTLLMPRGSATAIRDLAHGRIVDEPLLPDGETILLTSPLDEPAPAPVPPATLGSRREATRPDTG
jgi:MFS family permease